MRLESVTEEGRTPSAPVPPPVMTRFAPNGRGADAEHDLRARRYLWVAATAPRPASGGLRAAIDDAVEVALALRGALPARVEASAPLEAVIADQLFRAMALGAAGLAIAVPSLSAAADLRGALGPEDSAAVVAWLAASREAAVALVLEEADRRVQVLAPAPLSELIGKARPPASSPARREEPRSGLVRLAPPARSPAVAAERAASDLGEALGAAAASVDINVGEVASQVEAPPTAEAATPASGAPATPATVRPPLDGRPRGVLPPRSAKLRVAPAGERAAAATEHGGDAEASAPMAVSEQPVATKVDLTPVLGSIAAAFDATSSGRAAARGPSAAPEGEPLPPTRREPRKEQRGRIASSAEWRALAVELDNARGPKPVRVIEQLFATHYTPLLGAALSGEADAAVRGVVDAWRTSFEHSYRDAFSALRVTGKRPPMVFDAPDIAGRLARLNGARGVKLLLVDGMRFDLGERVAARVKDTILDRAILVERTLLWAALPTTTAAQMALLSRGAEGLRDLAPASDAEPAIARGRAVATLRRERAGSRELMKLDLVEARLRAAGPPFAERMDAIAEEVGDVVARFIESLPPRTLLLVFGDHGFRIAPLADGSATGPASQGGSSPEEVLMPAQAWLVGGVH